MNSPSPASALRLIESLSALAALLAALELLHQRHLFRPGQPYARPASRSQYPSLAAALRRMAPLYRFPATLASISLQAMAAAAVLWQSARAVSTVYPLLLLTLLAFLLHLRDHDASTGADRFLLLLLPACTLAELYHTGPARVLALCFIAGQAAIVYGSSGLLKLSHASWRNGSAVLSVLSGSQEGNLRLYLVLRARPRLATLCGLAVCAEALLAVAALLPPTLCCILLGGGVLMHLAIARIQGFNLFLLAFPASYPAVFFVSRSLYAHESSLASLLRH